MKYSAGFIGTGNMGGALALAVYKSDKNIALCDSNADKVNALKKVLKNAENVNINYLASQSKFVFLAVKPNVILKVAESIKGLISSDTVIVTMAAGVTLNEICKAACSKRVIRIMPNTPAAVGKGMILYCLAENVTEADEKDFLNLMSKAGITDKLDEKLFDAAAALSGCGPAFAYMFAQSLADGAVSCGVPRDKALMYAAQVLSGSAEMVLKSGKHPEKLKDDVCSPGGTTIEGVLTLEEQNFRSAVASAVTAAYEKTGKLKK